MSGRTTSRAKKVIVEVNKIKNDSEFIQKMLRVLVFTAYTIELFRTWLHTKINIAYDNKLRSHKSIDKIMGKYNLVLSYFFCPESDNRY